MPDRVSPEYKYIKNGCAVFTGKLYCTAHLFGAGIWCMIMDHGRCISTESEVLHYVGGILLHNAMHCKNGFRKYRYFETGESQYISLMNRNCSSILCGKEEQTAASAVSCCMYVPEVPYEGARGMILLSATQFYILGKNLGKAFLVKLFIRLVC